MPWFAWFSEKQCKLLGYACYLNKKGLEVHVTELSQDPEFKHPFKDSVRLGRVTHFCGVQQRNHTKKRGKEPDKMIPPDLKRQPGGATKPSLITN